MTWNVLGSLPNVSEFNNLRQNVQDFDSLVKFHVISSVSRKIILADIANLAEIACIADKAKLAKLAEPSRLKIADKFSRAEPNPFSNGHL